MGKSSASGKSPASGKSSALAASRKSPASGKSSAENESPAENVSPAEDKSAAKPGVKNCFNTTQNDLLDIVLDEYYFILEKYDVINLRPKAHIPKACSAFIELKRAELLKDVAFAELGDDELKVADDVNLSYSLICFNQLTSHDRPYKPRSETIRNRSS